MKGRALRDGGSLYGLLKKPFCDKVGIPTMKVLAFCLPLSPCLLA